MANRLEELEKEVRGLKRQIVAQEKSGTVVNFFTGALARAKRPFVALAEEGKELNAKNYFQNTRQASIEEELAEERKKRYAAAGLEVPEDPYYPESQD